ncbi:HAMP domain-containing histidine kinase [Vagococcus coleopterorum]|uniref:histidine kinase n=1 Tax=Vagococcus coleopterorum TaxID=2714946 RepID=A0A6G8AM11_9ENTE|nr:HAMP domain-containing sensor histidine kinase [Vagococcus coleopterorum]QIL46010.1 HAMP domain-containing histidine kinase [Vagococcus coleopterorum]
MENNNVAKSSRITLTSKEKSELIIEGFITIIILLLLNIAIASVSKLLIDDSLTIQNLIFGIKEVLVKTFFSNSFYSLKKFVFFIMLVIDVLIVYWRLIRRYRQMQLRHIITELHFIADGNYNHRIPFELSGDLGKVIDSVNGLVDSTVEAIEEERRIEKSKDELITNISHDIRTPLTSVIGFLGLIEQNKFSSEEELFRYSHTAYTKAQQMKVLVDDLFEYTKVRQSSAPVSLSIFDLNQLLNQLTADFEIEATNHGYSIAVDSKEKSIIIEADPEKLVRLFNNLISNALKYGVGGSKIILESYTNEGNAIITVKNNGQPIPKEALAQLFERFYRVEESRSKATGGSGLGLAIAESIVLLHNGAIRASSNDEWTSFTITIPLKQSSGHV